MEAGVVPLLPFGTRLVFAAWLARKGHDTFADALEDDAFQAREIVALAAGGLGALTALRR
jgi:hypothetical protein